MNASVHTTQSSAALFRISNMSRYCNLISQFAIDIQKNQQTSSTVPWADTSATSSDWRTRPDACRCYRRGRVGRSVEYGGVRQIKYYWLLCCSTRYLSSLIVRRESEKFRDLTCIPRVARFCRWMTIAYLPDFLAQFTVEEDAIHAVHHSELFYAHRTRSKSFPSWHLNSQLSTIPETYLINPGDEQVFRWKIWAVKVRKELENVHGYNFRLHLFTPRFLRPFRWGYAREFSFLTALLTTTSRRNTIRSRWDRRPDCTKQGRRRGLRMYCACTWLEWQSVDLL